MYSVDQLLVIVVQLHLKPLVISNKSYIKDTNHFLLLLDSIDEIPDNALLFTADVVGHYPNIPHGQRLEAIRQSLDTRRNPDISIDSSVWLGKLVLENNVFEFDGKVYRQKLGTAIGSKFNPAYANLFMASLEEWILECFVLDHGCGIGILMMSFLFGHTGMKS